MNNIVIQSKSDQYQFLETIKHNRNKRFKNNLFFVEGVRNINGAVRFGWNIRSFLYNPQSALSDWAKGLLAQVRTQCNYLLSASLMAELSDRETPSELCCLVEMKPDDFSRIPDSPAPFLALFDRPSNKGNLGTVIRTCDSLGVEGLLLTGHGVDLYDPEVVVATMGSFFSMPVLRCPDETALDRYLAQLRLRHPELQILGTTAKSDLPLYEVDLTGGVVLLIGNETMGLAKRYKESADRLVTIPMASSSYASSFNVACAATVMMYEVTRQRAQKGEFPPWVHREKGDLF